MGCVEGRSPFAGPSSSGGPVRLRRMRVSLIFIFFPFLASVQTGEMGNSCSGR
jgi:hypothetical protein